MRLIVKKTSNDVSTDLNPFISSDDSGDVLGIFSYGWHSQESIEEKAIEKFGLDHWVVKDLIECGSNFNQRYFILNGDNYLEPASIKSKESFPVSMWCRVI